MRETTILIIPIIQDANHMTDREHLLKKNDDMINKVLCMIVKFQKSYYYFISSDDNSVFSLPWMMMYR
jgi:hypothetical protein